MSEQPTLAFVDPKRLAMPIAEEALAWYRGLVEDTDQAEPMLLVGSLRGMVGMSLAFAERVQDGVHAGAALARDSGFYPMWLVASAEAWRRAYSTEASALEAADRLRHGDLEKAAELGDSRVAETVSIVALTRAGTGYLAVAEFKRTPAGVRWQPLEVFEVGDPKVDLIGGAVLAAMAEVLTSDPG